MQLDQLDWIESATVKAMAACHKTPYLLAASVIAGSVVTGASGNWVAGLLTGGIGAGMTKRHQYTTLKKARYALDYGAAPVAMREEEEIRDYASRMGSEQTAAQLLQAAQADINLSPAAMRFLEDFYGDRLDELLDQPLPEQQAKRFHLIEPMILKPQTPAPPNGPPPVTVEELLQRLKAECPALLKLVKAPPIRLVGDQRTGKNSFGYRLLLLRGAIIPGHKLAWATPHKEEDNPVPTALHPFGVAADGSQDIPAIEAAWLGLQAALKRNTQVNTSIGWNEFGSYDQFQDKQALRDNLLSMLRDSTKHGYYPIVVAHGDQASFYPEVKNIFTTLQKATIKVETIGEQVGLLGEMKPTGQVEITWRDGSQTRFKVPEWLTVDLLLKFQPEDTRPAMLQPTPPPPPSPKTIIQEPEATQLQDQGLIYTAPTEIQPPAVSENLVQSIEPPAVSESLAQPIQPPNIVPFPTPAENPRKTAIRAAVTELVEVCNGLPPGLQTKASELKPLFQELIKDHRDDLLWIAALSAKKGELTARLVGSDLKRKPWLKQLKEDLKNSEISLNDAIRAKFLELSTLQIGDCFGEGDRLTYLLINEDDRIMVAGTEDSEDAEDVWEEEAG